MFPQTFVSAYETTRCHSLQDRKMYNCCLEPQNLHSEYKFISATLLSAGVVIELPLTRVEMCRPTPLWSGVHLYSK
jgi:hypothetical protein